MNRIISLLLFMVFALHSFAQNETFDVWPGKVPGEEKPKAAHEISPNKKNNVIRIAEVTNPTVDVYRPEALKNNGAGVLICPGGGYKILAIDLEGSEIAEWLTDLGYTAFVLHYRVPKKYEGALDDAKRAMRIIRSRADEWSLNPDKLGTIGFSAGGSLIGRLAVCDGSKTYQPIDEIDKQSYRPNATCVIYSGGHVSRSEASQTAYVLDEHTSPFFLFQTQDDKFGPQSLIKTGLLLEANKVPFEMHVVPKGGHGYGLRKGNPAAELWPVLAEKWFEQILMK
jgi:acetyl esterase/lipase